MGDTGGGGKGKGRRFVSLQHKILAFTLVLVLIPLLSVGIMSYVKSAEIVQDKVSNSDLNTVAQIGGNIEFIFDYISDASLFMIQSEQVRQFLKLPAGAEPETVNAERIRTEQFLLNLLSMQQYIHSVYLGGFNGVSVVDTKATQQPVDEQTAERLIALKGRAVWEPREVVNFNGTRSSVISYMRTVKDINNLSDNLGILIINLDVQSLAAIYRSKTAGERDEFMIVDDRGEIVSAASPDRIGTAQPEEIAGGGELDRAKQGYHTIDMNGARYLLTYYNIGEMRWKVIHLVPLDELLKDNTVIPLILVVTVVISFLVCAVFAYLLSRKIISPVKKLRTLMQRVEDENFEGRIEVSGNDEIAQLGRGFNKMSRRLNELISQVYSAQIKQKEAELKALQAQIHPHFLYNTLNTIYWMSRMEKAFETAKLVDALSKLFRLGLSSGGEITSVRDEVEHLRNYIVIQQKRYEDTIDFHLHVQEETLDCKTVKLILQPFVENAIVHGMEKKEEAGSIRIDVLRDGDTLLYRISDTGGGVDVAEMERLLRQTEAGNRGFAIKNVNDRIQLYFGKAYGITFFNNEAGGTTVEVVQPWSGKGESAWSEISGS